MSIRGLTLEQIHDIEFEHTPLLGFRGRYFGPAETPRELDSDDLFVGRDVEIKRLTRSYRERQVICVYGNTGVGKTRFLTHAMESVADRLAWLDWSTMGEAWRVLAPEITADGAERPWSAEEVVSRLELVEFRTQRVSASISARAATGGKSVCVVVDNVELRSSDRDKAALLRCICSVHAGGRRAPVTVILCGRDAGLSGVLPAKFAARNVREFALRPLRSRDVSRLLLGAEQRAGIALVGNARREVEYACAGNPYFLNEIVSHADSLRQEAGKDQLVVGEEGARSVLRAALPGVLRKLADQVDMLRGITPKEQAILEAVARSSRVAGTSFSVSMDAASRSAGVDASKLIAILRNLTSKGDLLEIDLRSKSVNITEGLFVCALRTLHWLNSTASSARQRLDISAILPE